MASPGFIFEAPPLVSIYFTLHSLSIKGTVASGILPVYQCLLFTTPYFYSLQVCVVLDHFGYPAPPIGDWRHVKWYNLRLVQQTLEEMQQRVTCGRTPLSPLQITSSSGPSSTRSTASPSPSASSSQAHPEVTQKAPRSKAGKAQLAAASQKRGRGGGSKGICLEDPSASGRAKRRKRSDQPDSMPSHRPQYENMFEDSDDSNESFDGPFSGPPSSAVASSTTGSK